MRRSVISNRGISVPGMETIANAYTFAVLIFHAIDLHRAHRPRIIPTGSSYASIVGIGPQLGAGSC